MYLTLENSIQQSLHSTFIAFNMEKSHDINGSILSYPIRESLLKKNNKRNSVSIQCLNTIIQTETSKKPTNYTIMFLCWCLCILSIVNFRSQLTRIRIHEIVFPEVARSLIEESTTRTIYQATSATDRVYPSNDALSSTKLVTKQNQNALASLTDTLPRTDEFRRQRILPTNATNSGSITSHVGINEVRSVKRKDERDSDMDVVLCIRSDRWYGRTFNRILALANALALVTDDKNNHTKLNQEKLTIIGLSPGLSEWYETFLDSREDILLNYTGPCMSVWTTKDLFFIKEYKNTRKSRRQLQDLVPKKKFREEAEQAFISYSKNGQQQVITVHRRHLEGVCVKKAMGVSVACVKDRIIVKHSLSTNDLLNTCNYDYNMIQNKHQADIDQNKSVVVLCTDQQVPELDDTFPIRSNYSFPVEAWLMTKSDVHYGNPHSTVDLVVAVWRTGQHRRTHPEECYEEN